MQVPVELFLVLAGLVSGIVNSVAGGASLFLYPLLLSLGLGPITANASMSVVVLPGTVSAAVAYRKHLDTVPAKYLSLLIPCSVGGLLGAFLLLNTPGTTFEYLVPWFLLLATILLGLQQRIHAWVHSRAGREFGHRYPFSVRVLSGLSLVGLTVYGGYFGAGFGLLLLAVLGVTSLRSIHQMNALKNVGSLTMNSMAIAYFIVEGVVTWNVVPFLFLGDMVGGWIGATYGSRLPSRTIRQVVVAVGCIVTLVLFIQKYG